tara:strand:+ start:199 stop:444 length:246 start_codon:yes stop_codon:yes gene_type:complete
MFGTRLCRSFLIVPRGTSNGEKIMTDKKVVKKKSGKQEMMEKASVAWNLSSLDTATRVYMERWLKDKTTEKALKVILNDGS